LLSLKLNPPYTFLFAFEEAIGYMVGDVCFDKGSLYICPLPWLMLTLFDYRWSESCTHFR